MLPHERSLVEKLKDKPFAIVGVNCDPTRAEFQDAIRKERITWRSFYDGEPGGPISTAWNVNSWPTVYVLDAKGIIRFKDVRGDKLDKAIETMLAEMEGSGDER